MVSPIVIVVEGTASTTDHGYQMSRTTRTVFVTICPFPLHETWMKEGGDTKGDNGRIGGRDEDGGAVKVKFPRGKRARGPIGKRAGFWRIAIPP